MKHLLKGTAAVLIVMVISIVINIFCNMQGVELNSTSMTILYTICGLAVYQRLIRDEEDKES